MTKLHLGCGWRNFGNDWIHIDGGTYEHLQHHSVTDLSPFDDNSVDLIYASHVVEYFDLAEFSEVLKEWQRALRTGGTLRIAVPDFKILSELYVNGTLELENLLGPVYGRMPMGDKIIYHKMAYDFKVLKKTLTSAGFRNIITYDWRNTEHAHFDDHSQAYVPHMDKENGTLTSLNVECKK